MERMKTKDKHGAKVCELIERELEDYSYYEDWSFEFDEAFDGWEYYNVKIRGYDFFHLIRANEYSIQVQLGEDSWYVVRSHDWTIKYFWMAILKHN